MRNPPNCNTTRRVAGFTIVEIMVGMVIGMFGIIVMMQVFSLTEEQKRATTTGSDAVGNGSIIMHVLQRDIQQAGYSFSDSRILGCNLTIRTGVTINALAPVTINHASIPPGDAGTDTLMVIYGDASDGVQGDGITGTSAAANSYPVQTPTSFVANDNVVAVPTPAAVTCAPTMARVLSNGVAGNPNVTMASTVVSMPTSGGVLFNLGQSPNALVYAVRNGNLTLCRFININRATGTDSGSNCADASLTSDATVWVPVANNIVSLRAEYGHDVSAVVTVQSPVTGYLPMAVVNTFDQATPVGACALSRTSAVRLVLVARAGQFEKTAVTTAAPTWAGSATSPTPTPIDLSANADWQNYRYKVFQNFVTMRNASWMGVDIGC